MAPPIKTTQGCGYVVRGRLGWWWRAEGYSPERGGMFPRTKASALRRLTRLLERDAARDAQFENRIRVEVPS